jgi:hypothetical protein
MDVNHILLIGDAPEFSADMTDDEIDDACLEHAFVGVNNQAEEDTEPVLINMYDQQMVLSHKDAFHLAMMMSRYVMHSPYAEAVRPYYAQAAAIIQKRPDNTRLN